MKDLSVEDMLRTWQTDDPKRLIGRGHPVGDFLGAPEWEVLERGASSLRLLADLPEQVMNPRGDLFGGFTPTYVDFVALHVVQLGRDPDQPRQWLNTANLQVDYFAPIRGPQIEMIGELLQQRGRSSLVQLRFVSIDGELCALGRATLIEAKPG
jgi:acyl-coenzyme A thioesterase PaaI-like protein